MLHHAPEALTPYVHPSILTAESAVPLPLPWSKMAFSFKWDGALLCGTVDRSCSLPPHYWCLSVRSSLREVCMPDWQVDDKKDEPMPDAAAAGPAENGTAAEPERSGAEASTVDGAAPMDTEDKAAAAAAAGAADAQQPEVVKKKRTKKMPVPLSQKICGLPERTIQVRQIW